MGSTPSLFAALAGSGALAGTTATGRALEHWLDGGSQGQASEKVRTRMGLPPGGEGGVGFVSVHSYFSTLRLDNWSSSSPFPSAQPIDVLQ